MVIKTKRWSSAVTVGTGSGCIALALAKEISTAEIHATDISAAALEIARANAARHQLEDRVHFHHADLLADFDPSSFDFVVSNPPYVDDSEQDQVQLEVRKFEPRNAVFAGSRGTEVIARLVPQAHVCASPRRVAHHRNQRHSRRRDEAAPNFMERGCDPPRSPIHSSRVAGTKSARLTTSRYSLPLKAAFRLPSAMCKFVCNQMNVRCVTMI